MIYLLILKHFVADALLQTEHQYKNKHILLSPGLALHACIHGAFTAAVVSAFVPPSLALMCGFADTVIHWLIDWTKASSTHRFGWSEYGADDTGRPCLRIYDNKYFYALIADQCAHFATYVAIVNGVT